MVLHDVGNLTPLRLEVCAIANVILHRGYRINEALVSDQRNNLLFDNSFPIFGFGILKLHLTQDPGVLLHFGGNRIDSGNRDYECFGNIHLNFHIH